MLQQQNFYNQHKISRCNNDNIDDIIITITHCVIIHELMQSCHPSIRPSGDKFPLPAMLSDDETMSRSCDTSAVSRCSR